jgi:pilus assembly protein Flp/PilA
MLPLLRDLIHDESGQDMIEYALVAALVGLLGVGAIKSMSNALHNTFNSTGNALTSATS